MNSADDAFVRKIHMQNSRKHRREHVEVMHALDFNKKYLDHCLHSTLSVKAHPEVIFSSPAPRIMVDNGEWIIEFKKYHDVLGPSDMKRNLTIENFLMIHIATAVAKQHELAKDFLKDNKLWDQKKCEPLYFMSEILRNSVFHSAIWTFDKLLRSNPELFPFRYKTILICSGKNGSRMSTTGGDLKTMYEIVDEIKYDILNIRIS